MVVPAGRDQILQDLDQLTTEQKKRAAELVHGLTTALPRGGSIEALAVLAGPQTMMQAIEEGCERVDIDAW